MGLGESLPRRGSSICTGFEVDEKKPEVTGLEEAGAEAGVRRLRLHGRAENSGTWLNS